MRSFLQNSADPDLLTKRLTLLASNARRCRNFLEQHVTKTFQQICISSDANCILLDLHAFLLLHEEIQLRLLSQVLACFHRQKYPPRLLNLSNLKDRIVKSDNTPLKGRTLHGCKIQTYNKRYIIFQKENAKC